MSVQINILHHHIILHIDFQPNNKWRSMGVKNEYFWENQVYSWKKNDKKTRGFKRRRKDMPTSCIKKWRTSMQLVSRPKQFRRVASPVHRPVPRVYSPTLRLPSVPSPTPLKNKETNRKVFSPFQNERIQNQQKDQCFPCPTSARCHEEVWWSNKLPLACIL